MKRVLLIIFVVVCMIFLDIKPSIELNTNDFSVNNSTDMILK